MLFVIEFEKCLNGNEDQGENDQSYEVEPDYP